MKALPRSGARGPARWWCKPLILALRARSRWTGSSGASLNYTVNSRLVWATRDCLKTKHAVKGSIFFSNFHLPLGSSLPPILRCPQQPWKDLLSLEISLYFLKFQKNNLQCTSFVCVLAWNSEICLFLPLQCWDYRCAPHAQHVCDYLCVACRAIQTGVGVFLHCCLS